MSFGGRSLASSAMVGRPPSFLLADDALGTHPSTTTQSMIRTQLGHDS